MRSVEHGGSMLLTHNHVHSERTVPIVAGCIAHAQNGHISTSCLKSDVTLVFLNPNFF